MPSMSGLYIVVAYASVLGFAFVGLSVMTIVERRNAAVSLGYGDSEKLQRRIRAHANFAEYVPIALILMSGAAILGGPTWILHGMGVLLVAGRFLHATAIVAANGILRIVGMALTLTVVGTAALFDLVGVL